MASKDQPDGLQPNPRRRRRGPKPVAEGGPWHPHYFKPGNSGNPSGRPKKTERQKNFEEVCRQKAYESLDVLADAVKDESAPWRDRLQAFQMLAEHGHGKPVDRIAVKNMTDGAINAGAADREALGRQVAGLLARLDVVSEQ
ncbi:MAG: hypothetical protein KAJ01_04525 [Candidatus Hydrogenedentes bacterium]|nr:hypothetical protein [Candidatus Hydrogenedentota bacterium]